MLRGASTESMIVILSILMAFVIIGLVSGWFVKYKIDRGIKGWR